MNQPSCLPTVLDALASLMTALHQAFEHTSQRAHTVYAQADACWEAGDRAGYGRWMQEHARLLVRLDDLDALYWAANRTAHDVSARLQERDWMGWQ